MRLRPFRAKKYPPVIITVSATVITFAELQLPGERSNHPDRSAVIKPIPAQAWRNPLSPAKAATRGASKAGAKRRMPRPRSVQLNSSERDALGKPKV